MAGDGINDAAGAGPGSGRDYNGAMEVRSHTHQGRSSRDCTCMTTEPSDDAKYQTESLLRVRLQLGRSADRRRRLIPSFSILLSPIIAAAASFSSVSVITNALRLKKIEL
jgi:hypothetical protein